MQVTRFSSHLTIFAALLTFMPLSTPAQEAKTEGSDQSVIQTTTEFTREVYSGTKSGLGSAATAPLRDLNLKRDHIPIEIAHLKTPYDPVVPLNCEHIAFEVRVLNSVLGMDIDDEIELKRRNGDSDDKKHLSYAGKTSRLALDTISSEATSIVPFRSTLRQITGAKAHQNKVRQAYERADARRTFLKGLGMGMGCEYPAGPHGVVFEETADERAPIRFMADKPVQD